MGLFVMHFTATTFFSVSPNDKFVFWNSAVVDALHGVEAERLKICKICDNVYWAKKKTAKTCGDKKCVQRQKYLNRKNREG